MTPHAGREWYGIHRTESEVQRDDEMGERVLTDQTGNRTADTRWKLTRKGSGT